MARSRTESHERDLAIARLREEASRSQQEIKQLLNSSSADKEKMRAEYLAAIERQKQEVSALHSRLAATDKEGQNLDAKSRQLAEENQRLRDSLAASERQLANQTGEMAQQIKTYRIKLNDMLDQLEGKESMISNTESLLKSKEEALHAQQQDLQKHREQVS